ncbi:MAG TPA: hypothetical protein VGI76_01985 [Solirubrobacteraceae bacterium]
MVRQIWGLVAVVLALVVATANAVTAQPVVFTKTPPKQTNSTTAHFEWTGTGPYKCSLDEVTPVACASPQDFPGLSEGSHKFSVQGSGTGATAPPPVEYDWTVDLTPPTTVITQQPPALSNSTTATFAFNSPDPTAAFQCSLNGAPPQVCASPVTYTGLADAARTLLIQAVDPAGNVDTQAQPITWTVDTTPPDTTLADPGNIVSDSDPAFTFTSSEANATFQCALDDAPFAACASPDHVEVSHSGPHKFSVRAVDSAGNADPTPAVYSWTSDLTPPKRPQVTIFAAPSAKSSSASPVPKATPVPSFSPTFTNPLSKLLATPAFTLGTRLQAQWKSDSSAVSYDVTVTTLPEDSTGQDERGENVIEIKQYSHTKRTALLLKPGTGATVCVKVDALDQAGNVSKTNTACTTIPDSFAPFWGPYTFHRVRDSKAWRGYYIVLGHGKYLTQPIGDGAFFAPSRAELVAERCHGCGSVEFAFTKYPVGGHAFQQLATVDLDGKRDHQVAVDLKLPLRRLEGDGNGYIVIFGLSGRPRVSGVGFENG